MEDVKTAEVRVMEVNDGVYSLNSIEDQMKYANWLISKKLVSNTFKEPAPLIIAIQLCKDLSLPISCLKDFYVIGGRPAIFGDTFVALALGAGQVVDHCAQFYDEDAIEVVVPKKGQKLFSCVITGKRKGSEKECRAFYTMDDKEMAKSVNENWYKFQVDMLFRRSMGRFIKWYFADAIRGIELVEYAEDSVNTTKLDEKDRADMATNTFSG